MSRHSFSGLGYQVITPDRPWLTATAPPTVGV